MMELSPGTSPPPVRMPMRVTPTSWRAGRPLVLASTRPGLACVWGRFRAQYPSPTAIPAVPCAKDRDDNDDHDERTTLRNLAPARPAVLQGAPAARSGADHLRPDPAPRHRLAAAADPRRRHVPGVRGLRGLSPA